MIELRSAGEFKHSLPSVMPVTYKSESDPDYQCLEQYLKAGAFGSLPDAWIHQAQHDLMALQETLQKLVKNTPWLPKGIQEELSTFRAIELPTKYDSPLNFRLLNNLIVRIKAAAARIGLDVESFPHYSSIPTRQVNACAVNLPGASRPFLLFDSQLFLFCHLFAKAFSRCLPVTEAGEMVSLSTDIEKVREHVQSTPDVLERLIDVLNAYVTTDSPSNAKQYHLEGDYVDIVTIIRDGMELFVVAHEFGHVYAGHLSQLLAGTRLHTLPLESGTESHRQEYEADLIGLLLTLHAMNDSGYDAGLSYIGIDLFFASLDMAAQYAHLIAGGDDETFKSPSSDSHPSNQERRNFLNSMIEHIVSPIEQAESARTLSSHYKVIASYLWSEVRRQTHHFTGLALKAAEAQ